MINRSPDIGVHNNLKSKMVYLTHDNVYIIFDL